MYYVYTLSFKNKVFYIGYTSTPMLRFLGHISCSSGYTKYFIQEMLLKYKKAPVLNIVFHSKDKQCALSYEKKLIKSYSDVCHKLLNIHGNATSNIIYFNRSVDFKRQFYFEYKYDHETKKSVTDYINKFIYKIPSGYQVGYNKRIVKS